MSRPSASQVHVDRVLTNLAIGYVQSDAAFVAQRAFARIPVSQDSGKYYTFTAADFLRNEVQQRAPGAEAAEADFAMSTATFTCEERAIRKFLPDSVRDTADDPMLLERNIVAFLTQKMRIERDRKFAADHFAASKWDNDPTPSTKWDVATGGNPFSDNDTGHETILKAIGQQANAMIVSMPVHNALKRNPLVVERVKYAVSRSLNLATAPGNLPEVYAALAALFEVEEYMVCKSAYDSANENATSVPAWTLGEHALLLYRSPSPSIMSPSGGYTFVNTAFGPNGMELRRYRDEGKRGEYFELGYSEDMKLTASAAGYLHESVLT